MRGAAVYEHAVLARRGVCTRLHVVVLVYLESDVHTVCVLLRWVASVYECCRVHELCGARRHLCIYQLASWAGDIYTDVIIYIYNMVSWADVIFGYIYNDVTAIRIIYNLADRASYRASCVYDVIIHPTRCCVTVVHCTVYHTC